MAIHTQATPDQGHDSEPKKLDRKKWYQTVGGKVAVGVTALLAGGTVTTGVVYNANKAPEPGTTTAGPQTPGAGGETSPATPEVFAPKDKSDIDLKTFPFVVGGETYEGEDAFMQACEVSASEYRTAEEALPVLLQKLNDLTKAGQTSEELARYANYFPNETGWETLPAVVDEIYNPAYLQCLELNPDQPTAFTEGAADQATLNSVAWSLSAKNGDSVPYTATYTANLENAHMGNPEGFVSSTFTGVKLDYTDNGDQNSVGPQRTEKHWQGIGTARDYYSSIISGEIKVRDGHWTLNVTSQHFTESSRPMG